MEQIDLSLCGCLVRVHCSSRGFRDAVEIQFRPVALEVPANRKPSAEVALSENGVRILEGPAVESLGELPLLELEWVLGQLCLLLRQGIPLHTGCVVWQDSIVILAAPSEGGKSTMTLSALRNGATYVTDDMLILQGGYGYGLGRAVRFKLEPLRLAREHLHLRGMDLESQILLGGPEPWTAPLYPGPYKTLNQVKFSQFPPPVVVRVARGGVDAVGRLSSLERAVILHEAAIVKYGEYDGCLGPGPTFELTWADPDRSFDMLAKALSEPH